MKKVGKKSIICFLIIVILFSIIAISACSSGDKNLLHELEALRVQIYRLENYANLNKELQQELEKLRQELEKLQKELDNLNNVNESSNYNCDAYIFNPNVFITTKGSHPLQGFSNISRIESYAGLNKYIETNTQDFKENLYANMLKQRYTQDFFKNYYLLKIGVICNRLSEFKVEKISTTGTIYLLQMPGVLPSVTAYSIIIEVLQSNRFISPHTIYSTIMSGGVTRTVERYNLGLVRFY